MDVDMLRKIAALGYGVGAIMALATTILPDPDPSDHVRMVELAAADAVFALVLILGRRLPAWAIRLIAITGAIATVSWLVAVILPIGASLVLYCWPALTAGYWCSRRELYANLAFMGVASAVALSLSRSPDITGSTWSTTFLAMIIVALMVSRLVRRVEVLVSQITRVASEDGLTGLLNRRAFEPALEREVERALALGAPLSIAVFDLDHFKLVNDRFGHAAGDDALRRFGRILGDEIRDVDVAGRVGGEEFCVLLFGMGREEARRWAEGVSALLIAETLGEEVELTTSVGVASLGGRLTTCEDLQLAADRALYAAKASGRRQVVVAGPELRPALALAG
jgi:diguanylate cyclase (GGDEF)-like protein